MGDECSRIVFASLYSILTFPLFRNGSWTHTHTYIHTMEQFVVVVVVVQDYDDVIFFPYSNAMKPMELGKNAIRTGRNVGC